MAHQPAVLAHERSAAWLEAGWTVLIVLGAFALYAAGAAPGLTWAHQGADGGELVTAAVVNGVPHPPGYPLYIMLLQAWLWLAQSIGLSSDLIWQAALFSALCAALSVGVTLHTARYLLVATGARHALLWATLAAAAWAISPLLWTQAVIAEVYALHALLLALLGWAVLVQPTKLWYIALLIALGVANHLTTLLLLPATVYAAGAAQRGLASSRGLESALRLPAAITVGLLLGALLYLRIPWAAGNAPPINWGYADNWQGFWWLVSGAAYRGYLFDGFPGVLLSRLAGWAYTVTVQYTPVGLALALLGLAYWDRTAGRLRNFSLLWILPVSAYAIVYYTRDSEIYLLPVAWLMALWLAAGLAQLGAWAARRLPRQRLGHTAGGTLLVAAFITSGLLGLGTWRWSGVSLGADHAARDYLVEVAAVLQPGSIVVTMEDRETFALWYGIWGSKELAESVPGVVSVNDSLYQFDWYRRLQSELHPAIGGIGESIDALVAANRGMRPIYFAYLPAHMAETDLLPTGPLWKLKE